MNAILEATPDKPSEDPPRSRWRRPGRWLMLLVAVVGVLASAAGWWWLTVKERDYVRSQFQRDARFYADSVETQLSEKQLNMRALLAFFRSSEEVTHDEFVSFGKTYLEGREQIVLVAWVPYIAQGERAAFEQRLSKELGQHVVIKELSEGNSLRPSGERPEYAPTRYMWRQQLPAEFGFDWFEIGRVARVMRHVRQRGGTEVAGPFRLPGSDDSGLLYGFVAAVVPEDTSQTEDGDGWLIGLLRMDEVIEEAMSIRPRTNLVMELIDEEEQRGDAQVLAWSVSEEEVRFDVPMNEDEAIWRGQSAADLGLVYERHLALPGPQWTIRARPTREYIVGKTDPGATVFLMSGLLVTLLSVLYVNTSLGRTERVERLVDERTASLREHREKLRTIAIEMARARQEAVEATRAKSSFLANMSHEIRTPMNGVIGMAELLTETELNSKQREYLTLLDRSARGLLALLNDILDFSKIEAGQLELDRREFRLTDTVAETLQVLATRAEKKGLELVYTASPEVPFAVIGDPDRLRQVLINLVGNAIKFTERGQIEVRVDCESCRDHQVTVHFAVRDTGVGIPKKEQKRIFEAFRQADSSSRREHEGTGLGLSISTQLVDLMGGQIELESEEGVGTEVRFSLRLELSQEHREEGEAKLLGRRVLVVDDNQVNRRLFRALLASWKVQAEVVDDVKAARERIAGSKEDFDALILDVVMPRESGLVLAREGLVLVREVLERVGHTPAVIVVSSAVAFSEAAAEEEVGQICARLSKPVKPTDLYEALVGCLLEGQKASEVTVAQSEARDGEGLCVLLVEDSEVNQKVARGLLARGNHRVELARDGQEAIDAFERDPQRFDLILMDIQMPRVDGFEATRQIRALEAESPAERTVPIVALTAHAMKGDRERMLREGMDDYLAKPLQPDELMRVIEKWRPVEGERPDEGTAGETQEHEEVDMREAKHDQRKEQSAQTPESQEASREAEGVRSGLWDPEIAAGSTGGDEDLLQELAELFVEESSDWLRELQAALGQRNAREVRRLAHTIKGSALVFGARKVGQLAEQLEMMGKDDALEQAPPRYEQLVAATAEFNAALRSELLDDADINHEETSSQNGSATSPGARADDALGAGDESDDEDDDRYPDVTPTPPR
ncbi:response regulator [Lujinxingia sediminis]|uniref:histidine kinase n=1 Tax=Lujinxingia sediminis TaxID=2480984 RepID=A0ABY0CPQ4_9DELT|nr:response regulator [Lujinxingia sediminis]RVU42439.1 response regulator [Lujinxingia sediminis]